MKRSAARLAVFLKETLILKDLSPERAAPYIGCTSRQVRRWIEGEVDPSPVHMQAIDIGIKKINHAIPGDTPEGLVSWRKGPEVPKEEKIFNEQLNVFFDTICKKVGMIEREHILFDDDYMIGFQEILFLARKHGVELPNLA